MSRNPTLCIAGKNRVAIDVLDRAVALNAWRVVALPNSGDEGHDAWQPSFRKAALDRGIEVVDLRWAERQEGLCFLSVEFDRLIKPAGFQTHRLFNIHFSLLPRYRGCNTAIWPILNGEKTHGVTLHWIDAGMDTGPIIDQASFPIGDMTARDLYFRCMAEAVQLVDLWLERLVAGAVPARVQDETCASTYPRAALDFARAEIDPKWSVNQVLRSVRAFHFPEYQLARLGSAAVLRAQAVTDAPRGEPGRHQQVGPGLLRLWVSDGAVDLELADQAH